MYAPLKQAVINSIREDNYPEDQDDWWTSCNYELDGIPFFLDVNVYDNTFDDNLEKDERAVSVYAVITTIDDEGSIEYTTDHECNAYSTFVVNLKEIISNDNAI